MPSFVLFLCKELQANVVELHEPALSLKSLAGGRQMEVRPQGSCRVRRKSSSKQVLSCFFSGLPHCNDPRRSF